MALKEKANELVEKYVEQLLDVGLYRGDVLSDAKQCALICIGNEYYAVRELLFNLRSCRVIKSEKVYLIRIDELIKEEKELKKEIGKL